MNSSGLIGFFPRPLNNELVILGLRNSQALRLHRALLSSSAYVWPFYFTAFLGRIQIPKNRSLKHTFKKKKRWNRRPQRPKHPIAALSHQGHAHDGCLPCDDVFGASTATRSQNDRWRSSFSVLGLKITRCLLILREMWLGFPGFANFGGSFLLICFVGQILDQVSFGDCGWCFNLCLNDSYT